MRRSATAAAAAPVAARNRISVYHGAVGDPPLSVLVHYLESVSVAAPHAYRTEYSLIASRDS